MCALKRLIQSSRGYRFRRAFTYVLIWVNTAVTVASPLIRSQSDFPHPRTGTEDLFHDRRQIASSSANGPYITFTLTLTSPLPTAGALAPADRALLADATAAVFQIDVTGPSPLLALSAEPPAFSPLFHF